MDAIDYTYDNVQRLLQADSNTGERVYDFTYDLAGNRLEEDLSGTGVTDKLTEFEYTDANQILRKRVDGGSWSNFTYDNNGNLTDDGVNSYTWDRANRLLEVDTGTPAELTAYAYDGLNNRISQAIGTSSPVVTQYLLDTQPALTKVIGATVGGNTDRFIHAPRGIHSVENSSGSWRYALQDGLGSVRAEVDNLGAVQASQSYEPYGEVFGASGSFASPYGFTGEQTDDNGQVYLRARYYNPSIGVFNALDPFEGIAQRPMSLNGYSWVEGNPIMNIDPSGKQACSQYERRDSAEYARCLGRLPGGEASQACPEGYLISDYPPTHPLYEPKCVLSDGTSQLASILWHDMWFPSSVPEGWDAITWGLYTAWQDTFVHSQWSQDIRNNPEDAILTIAYAGGAIVLIVATGGGAAIVIGGTKVVGTTTAVGLTGAGATVLADMSFDWIAGETPDISDLPASSVIGNGLFAGLGQAFTAGTTLTKVDVFLGGTTLAIGKLELELITDYLVDGNVNLKSPISYLVDLVSGGTISSQVPGDFAQAFASGFATGLSDFLNSGCCKE